MKKKSMKQQLMTVFSMAVMMTAIVVSAPNQALANGKGLAKVSKSYQSGVTARSIKTGRGDDRIAKGYVGKTKTKIGPKQPLGVWVWVNEEEGYVWFPNR